MKRNHRLNPLVPFFLATLLVACEEVPTPDACITGPERGFVGEMVEFSICTEDAEFMSIWTGDSTHMYSMRDDTTMVDRRGRLVDNQGRDVTGRSSYFYIYREPGTFAVTLVATNAGNNGTEIRTTTDEWVITITGEQR